MPVDIIVQEVQTAFDEVRLYKDSCKQHDPCLYDETEDESPSPTISKYAGCVSEDSAAQYEGGNGYQTLCPPVGPCRCVGCGGTKAEENCIARLAGDECAVGVKEGRI